MVVRDSLAAISDGDQLNDGYFNGIYYGLRTQVVYTGDGFDTAVLNAGTIDTDSYEFATITATEIGSADYLEISITGTASATSNDQAVDISLKIETKNVGGAYGTRFNKVVLYQDANAGESQATSTTTTVSYLHTLSVDEKADGVVVQITSVSDSDANQGSGSFTNTQTVIRGCW